MIDRVEKVCKNVIIFTNKVKKYKIRCEEVTA